MAIKITWEGVELLSPADPTVAASRLTQLGLEILSRTSDTITAMGRTTAAGVELLSTTRDTITTMSRTGWTGVEALVLPDTPARITQLGLEVMQISQYEPPLTAVVAAATRRRGCVAFL